MFFKNPPDENRGSVKPVKVLYLRRIHFLDVVDLGRSRAKRKGCAGDKHENRHP